MTTDCYTKLDSSTNPKSPCSNQTAPLPTNVAILDRKGNMNKITIPFNGTLIHQLDRSSLLTENILSKIFKWQHLARGRTKKYKVTGNT
ncbi:hypothetical protein QL285_084179 [Trifolium repens]|nr:hypothetical protein QL285_084179 [Trifolium repens]